MSATPRPDDGRPESENQRLDRNWAEILQEFRVTLTGSQIVAGFLLAVAFQQRFEELDRYQLVTYLVLVGLSALATLVGLAPVVAHRLLFRRLRKDEVVRLGNRYLVTTAILVAVLAAGVSHLVFDFVVGRIVGVVAGIVVLAFAVALWVVPIALGGERGVAFDAEPDGGGPHRA